MENNKKFYLSSDHAGFELKEKLKGYLQGQGIEVVDLGPNTDKESVSYAEYGKKLAIDVLNDKEEGKEIYGIGVCGTGLGISYAVNRYKGIRGARITSIEDAHLAKQHNNSNILLFGGRQTKFRKAKKMLNEFLNTKYENGRHQLRVEELDK